MNQGVDRRKFLRLMGGAGAAACPICLAAGGALASGAKAGGGHGRTPHWGYDGAAGPSHWGRLSPDFKVCEVGLQQSPIDLKGATPADPGTIDVTFRKMPLRIVNNGHTIQVKCAPGSRSRIAGKRYELVQFHFHHPSEHLLNGKKFPLELHFVHRAADGGLAVIGVFMRRGQLNPALQPIWNAFPAAAGPERSAGVDIDPMSLLPPTRTFYRYSGSLTTPPCSEGIVWSVLVDPIELSQGQVRRFAALFPSNARPARPLGTRYLLESR